MENDLATPSLTPLSFFGKFGTSTNPLDPSNHAQIDKIPFTQLKKEVDALSKKFLEQTKRAEYVTEEWRNQYAALEPKGSIVIGSQWGVKEDNDTYEIHKLKNDTGPSADKYVAYGDYATLFVRLNSSLLDRRLQMHMEELLYFDLSPLNGLTQLIEKNFTPITQINLDSAIKRIHIAKGIYETVYIFLKFFKSHGDINPHNIGIGGEYIKIRGFKHVRFLNEKNDATSLQHVHHSYKGPEAFSKSNPMFVSSGCNDLFALGLLMLHVIIPQVPFYFDSVQESFAFMHNHTTDVCDCFYYLDETEKNLYQQLPLEPKRNKFGIPDIEKQLSGLLQTKERIIYSDFEK